MLGLSMAFAQPIDPKFGKVEEEYVKMTTYPADTSADAVVLYHHGNVSYGIIGGELKLITKIHRRIKILRPGGLHYADVGIPYLYFRSLQKISEFKAVTHYVDESGKVVQQKVERKDLLDEKVDNRWHIRKFSFPNAKEGALLEYAYSITSDFLFSISNWYFQEEIPVAYSRYEMQIPKEFDFRVLTMGATYPLERKQERVTKSLGRYSWMGRNAWDLNYTTYTCRNIPALVEEPYTTSMKNFYFHLDIQLQGIYAPGYASKDYLKSWHQLSAQLMADEDFGEYLKSTKDIKSKVEEILASCGDTDEEKIAAIYSWIQQNINWDDSRGIYADKNMNALLKEQSGNGTSLNLLLINMLREAGFKAYPMLICTRDNGLPQNVFPTLDQFNHTIVALDRGEQALLMDVRSKLTPYDMLPMEDLNRMGMIVTPNGAQWLKIKPNHKSEQNIHAIMKLSPQGELEGNIKTTNYGYMALEQRAGLRDADDREAYLRGQVSKGFAEVEVLDYSVKQEEDLQQPLKLACELETSDYVQQAGDFIYLQPMLNEATKNNPFKLEERKYPVDFGVPMYEKYIFNLILPEGYAVEEAPKPVRLTLPDHSATFLYHTAAMGNQLQLMSEIKIDKTLFPTEEYKQIKQFYDLIVAKHAEQIVLKKSNLTSGNHE